ncbi:MAG: Tetratricopeptide repeat protein [Spirochaetes bacterium ADurb.Bin133]|nr:MAG: Tetratricopeptide repeat protein [Spirochaetes bacterium ADurb.Bin133]
MRFRALFIIFCALLGCKSSDSYRDYFRDLSVKCSVALKFDLYIRTTKVSPEVFYIQNLRTFELYKFSEDVGDIFYIDGLPLGEYKICYWIADYSVNEISFKTFSYLDITFALSEPGSYSLGKLFHQISVNSMKVSPVKIDLKPSRINSQKYSYYAPVENYKINDIEKSEIFKTVSYGVALYSNENTEVIYRTLADCADIEKNTINSYLKVIDKEYAANGLDAALNLIKGYSTLTRNINLTIKAADLYFEEGKPDVAHSEFVKLIAIDPNIPEYYGLLGEIEISKGNIEKAEEYLYKAVSLNTSNALTYNAYAKILIDKSELTPAQKLNDRALALDPGNKDFLDTKIAIEEKLR